mmetsp:Transcript_125107/g.350319  ORF Transcript_125107/g.350319 Transcript_125107/m.350319 type:complete len:246 (+) Transcript_125107:280-1017(+)
MCHVLVGARTRCVVESARPHAGYEAARRGRADVARRSGVHRARCGSVRALSLPVLDQALGELGLRARPGDRHIPRRAQRLQGLERLRRRPTVVGVLGKHADENVQHVLVLALEPLEALGLRDGEVPLDDLPHPLAHLSAAAVLHHAGRELGHVCGAHLFEHGRLGGHVSAEHHSREDEPQLPDVPGSSAGGLARLRRLAQLGALGQRALLDRAIQALVRCVLQARVVEVCDHGAPVPVHEVHVRL